MRNLCLCGCSSIIPNDIQMYFLFAFTSFLLIASRRSSTTSSPSQSVALKPLVQVKSIPCRAHRTLTVTSDQILYNLLKAENIIL